MNRIIQNGLNPLSKLAAHGFFFRSVASVARNVNFVYKPSQTAWHQWKVQRFYSVYSAPLDLNLKQLTKDVIVYRYENPRFFKFLNICAFVQFFTFSMLAEFNFRELRNVPVDEKAEGFDELPIYKRNNLGTPTFRTVMAVLLFGIGKDNLHQCVLLN